MRYIILSLFFIFFSAGCCKDHSELIPGQDFIPDEILEEIIANGQPIYDGYDPPSLEGTYLIAPLTRISSNFPDNANNFGNKEIRFYDFNRNSLTLKMATLQGGSEGEGFGSFISGEGDYFTVYVRIDAKGDDGSESLTTQVYSGRIVDNGIEDLTYSLFMINDYGDINDDLIEIGQGRTFVDGDGFSPKI